MLSTVLRNSIIRLAGLAMNLSVRLCFVLFACDYWSCCWHEWHLLHWKTARLQTIQIIVKLAHKEKYFMHHWCQFHLVLYSIIWFCRFGFVCFFVIFIRGSNRVRGSNPQVVYSNTHCSPELERVRSLTQGTNPHLISAPGDDIITHRQLLGAVNISSRGTCSAAPEPRRSCTAVSANQLWLLRVGTSRTSERYGSDWL